MAANFIDGAAIAQALRAEVARETAELVKQGKPQPGLATVLVGDNPASQSYVSSKKKACAEVGIASFGHELPATASQAEVETLVKELNADPRVNGILVQLPLPKGSGRGRRIYRPSASRRTWMAFTRSTSGAWRKRDATRCSCPAHRPV